MKRMEKQGLAAGRVRQEFQRFRCDMLYRGRREALWDACGKIHFYSCVMEYFENNLEIPEKYLDAVLAEEEPVRGLWEIYLKYEQLSYQTWEALEGILETLSGNSEFLTSWEPEVPA